MVAHKFGQILKVMIQTNPDQNIRCSYTLSLSMWRYMENIILSNVSLVKLVSVLLLSCAILLVITFTTAKSNKTLTDSISEDIHKFHDKLLELEASLNSTKEKLNTIFTTQQENKSEIKTIIADLKDTNKELYELCSKLDMFIKFFSNLHKGE